MIKSLPRILFGLFVLGSFVGCEEFDDNDHHHRHHRHEDDSGYYHRSPPPTENRDDYDDGPRRHHRDDYNPYSDDSRNDEDRPRPTRDDPRGY